MTNAEAMKKLRKKRKEKSLCTRCGAYVKKDNKTICKDCRKYLNHYKRHGYPPPHRTKKFIHRSPKNEIKNKRLAKEMKDREITTKKLSKKIKVTQRTVQHWLFDGTDPRRENKLEVNEFFEEEIFKVKDD